MIAEMNENTTGSQTLVLYVFLGRCPHGGSQKSGMRLDLRKVILVVQEKWTEERLEAQESMRDLLQQSM